MGNINFSKIMQILLVIIILQTGIVIGLSISYFQINNQLSGPGQSADQSGTADTRGQNISIEEIPDSVVDSEIQGNKYSIRFQRNSENSELLDRYLHDPILIRGGGDNIYLIASEAKKGNQVLYMTNTSAPTDWELVDDYYFASEKAINDIVHVQNRYIAYANDGIYTSKDIVQDNWTRERTEPPGTSDLGAYHDGERVHIYYESDLQNYSGPSGKEIGHATSPDGITNWTHYPSVFRASGEYGVGDFEVVNRGDAVLLIGDYSRTHPEYEIRIWTNDNLYTEFTMLERPAIAPRSGDTKYTDDFGVQDGTVLELENDSYIMVANGHASPRSEVRLHFYVSTD